MKLNYEEQIRRHFSEITTISELADSVFRAYPVRVRTQQNVIYFEIGARNIDKNGNIVLLNSDRAMTSANKTAYEAQRLCEGDIIIPYRNKHFRAALYRGSRYAFLPNPSLYVIRSGSLMIGEYILLCLQQPFIESYLSSLVSAKGKLEIEDISELIIPVPPDDIETRLHEINGLRQRREQAEEIAGRLLEFEKSIQPAMMFEELDTHTSEIDRKLVALDRTLEVLKAIVSELENDTLNDQFSFLHTEFKGSVQ